MSVRDSGRGRPGAVGRTGTPVVRALVVCAALLLVASASAQRLIEAQRADGRMTPLMVYASEQAQRGCAPLAVISPGAGGSESGYRYLAKAMAYMGYTAVVMGHKESGMGSLRADVRADGIKAGIRALVTSRRAEDARLLDVGAALKWAESQCRRPFRVLLGHSMGSETVMLEAGAKNQIGVTSPPAGQDRFDAYVALSPEGPGVVFPPGAWAGIHKPVLILTGTRDHSLNGSPANQQLPWHDLPGRRDDCQWMGVIRGATHLNFAGLGLGNWRVETRVEKTLAAFLAGVQRHDCMLPAPQRGMTLQAK